jgi:DnaJ family protein A protein 2
LRYKRPFDKGALYITFEIIFPIASQLTPDKMQMLEAALPARPALPKMNDPEEVVLTTVDPARQSHQHSMEEDEEQQQQPGVQCAQQ